MHSCGFILSLIYYYIWKAVKVKFTRHLYLTNMDPCFDIYIRTCFFQLLFIQLLHVKTEEKFVWVRLAGSDGFRCCRAHFRVHIFSGANLTWKSRVRVRERTVCLSICIKNFNFHSNGLCVCDPLAIFADLVVRLFGYMCDNVVYGTPYYIVYWLYRTHTDMHE